MTKTGNQAQSHSPSSSKSCSGTEEDGSNSPGSSNYDENPPETPGTPQTSKSNGSQSHSDNEAAASNSSADYDYEQSKFAPRPDPENFNTESELGAARVPGTSTRSSESNGDENNDNDFGNAKNTNNKKPAKRIRVLTSSSLDREETEQPQHSPDDGYHSRRSRKRRLSDDILQLVEENPELLGIRRSHRERKEVQRFAPPKGSSDEDSTHARGGKHSKKRSASVTPDDSVADDYSSTKGKRCKLVVKTKKRRHGGGSKKQVRRLSSNSTGDDEESSLSSDERIKGSRSMRRVYKDVNYCEESDDSADAEDLLEPVDDDVVTEEPAEDRDGIEKIIRHRIGRRGATGPGTTLYNIEDRGDPNKDFIPTSENPGETQFLIKWNGWSHVHNTWESEDTLVSQNVKGLKKLENYQKRQAEIEDWKRTADKDYIEYFECEQEMSEELYNQYTVAERIIAHSKNAERGGESVDYYVKWCGLPYSDCSWEVDTLVARWFQKAIGEYNKRLAVTTLPSKSCKFFQALKYRPKFVQLKTQPTYIGGVDELELRDYQLDGLNWLAHAWCKCNGVILADEMGLGKTIQSISFLSYLFHAHNVYGPFLVVVPLSTLASWQKEFQTWAPDLNVIVYIGDVISRETIRQYEWYTTGHKLKCNAVLTTYEIVLKDKSFLGAVDWSVLAVDEAHRLKNDEALLYKAMFEFKTNHRLLVTGTPLQNSLKELWSLLHFIMPEKFDDWEDFEEAHQASENKGYDTLHKVLEPFLFRRVKKDVEKSLPAKVEQILRVDMTSKQKQFYRWILTKNYKALSKGVKGSISGFLNVVMELKKCCNHPFLIRAEEQDSNSERLEALVKSSGKLILLDKLLCRLYETGHRVLIFSQMVLMLELIQEYLRLRRFNFQRLDGSIRGDVRKQALDHFNAEGSQDFVFLLSTRAGGLGINLATADTVIIFDSDWNPQNDLQAQSRAHRIGQTKQVNIYRFVTKSSVEEEIVERAKRKLVLDHLVIQRMDTTGRTVLSKNAVSNSMPFNKDELNAILKFGAEELFKEKEDEDGEPDVDVDLILQRAETREIETTGGAADDLLSQFKVANFTIDEDSTLDMPRRPDAVKNDKQPQQQPQAEEKSWDDIIPEDERLKAEEEERKEAEEILAPRSRNRLVQKMARNEDSDDEDWKSNGKKIKKEESESGEEEESDDERPKAKRQKKVALHGFTEAEIRKFVRSYRKFPQPLTRLEAIACDAELEEHSKKELQLLADSLENGCRVAVEEYTASSLSHDKENTAEADDSKKRDRGPVFKLGGVEVNVKPLLKSQADLEALALVIPSVIQERRRFEIPGHVKLQKTWDCEWTDADDAALLRGIYDYGFGSWERIKMDPELCLTEKILPMDKLKKPQGKHLQTRADYLLRFLQKKVELNLGNKPKPLKKSPVKPVYIGGVVVTAEAAALEKKERVAKRKKALRADAEISGGGAETVNGRLRRSKDNKEKEHGAIPKLPKPQIPAVKLDGLKVDLTLDAALEGDVFNECKVSMKPLKEDLRTLNEDSNSEKFIVALLKIGSRISHCLASKNADKKQLSDWHSYFWLFASKFSELNGAQLHKKFKQVARKQASSHPHEGGGAEDLQMHAEAGAAPSDEKHKHKHRHRHHHHHGEDHPAIANNNNSSQKFSSSETTNTGANETLQHQIPGVSESGAHTSSSHYAGDNSSIHRKRAEMGEVGEGGSWRTSSPLVDRDHQPNPHGRPDRSTGSSYGLPAKASRYRQENADTDHSSRDSEGRPTAWSSNPAALGNDNSGGSYHRQDSSYRSGGYTRNTGSYGSQGGGDYRDRNYRRDDRDYRRERSNRRPYGPNQNSGGYGSSQTGSYDRRSGGPQSYGSYGSTGGGPPRDYDSERYGGAPRFDPRDGPSQGERSRFDPRETNRGSGSVYAQRVPTHGSSALLPTPSNAAVYAAPYNPATYQYDYASQYYASNSALTYPPATATTTVSPPSSASRFNYSRNNNSSPSITTTPPISSSSAAGQQQKTHSNCAMDSVLPDSQTNMPSSSGGRKPLLNKSADSEWIALPGGGYAPRPTSDTLTVEQLTGVPDTQKA